MFKNSQCTRRILKIGRNPANPLLRQHVPGQICSSPTILGPKKIRKEREKKKNKSQSDFFGFRQVFAGITIHGSLESLLRAFWEKI
jgi:hypothetical protein